MQNVHLIQDNSIDRKIKKVAKKLDNKYSKKRKICNWFFKDSIAKTIGSIIVNVIFITTITVACLFCICTINARINKTPPTFAGYSLMKISSGSMVDSGFNIGDNIVVKSVKTDSLRVGDKISFYVYSASTNSFDYDSATKLNLEKTNTKYNINIKNFFGFQTPSIKQASNAKSMLVFHEIVNIYEDNNGERWFETKGSSNLCPDVWKINENYVVGIYDDSVLAYGLANVLNLFNDNGFLISLILVPFILFTILIVFYFAKNIQRAKIELDVVEEKRKLTDEICVKNGIGYTMDKKSKYKVLAQASDEEKPLYLALLWKNGSAPNSIRKYVLRKQLYLNSMKKMLNLNRKCEEMFKNNIPKEDIAKYYITEKEKIMQDQDLRRDRLNKIRKNINK